MKALLVALFVTVFGLTSVGYAAEGTTDESAATTTKTTKKTKKSKAKKAEKKEEAAAPTEGQNQGQAAPSTTEGAGQGAGATAPQGQ